MEKNLFTIKFLKSVPDRSKPLSIGDKRVRSDMSLVEFAAKVNASGFFLKERRMWVMPGAILSVSQQPTFIQGGNQEQ